MIRENSNIETASIEMKVLEIFRICYVNALHCIVDALFIAKLWRFSHARHGHEVLITVEAVTEKLTNERVV
jgi:hypothetical protein